MKNIIIESIHSKKIESIIKKLPHKRVFIIADSSTSLYLGEVSTLFHNFNKAIDSYVFPCGETSKTMKTVLDICTKALEYGLDRNSLFVSLGGGICGDITGFAASIFMRGVDYIQIPTSLLAMVDASIGGKTGVNLKAGKNLIGSFYKPLYTFVDPSFLNTLPLKELNCGLFEIIKYGCILDKSLFKYIENNDCKSYLGNEKVFNTLIKRSIEIKYKITNKDFKETSGKRILLNYGHTFGHVIEKLSNYKYTHGESIAFGMIIAAFMSYHCKVSNRENALAQINLIKKYCTSGYHLFFMFKLKDILKTLKVDKKNSNGNFRMILTDKVGHGVVKEFDIETLAFLTSEFLKLGQDHEQ